MRKSPRIDSRLPQPSLFLHLVPFSVRAEVVPIFQVKKLRSLAGTHPRSPGDSEAGNLGLVLLMQALPREDMAAVCCCIWCGAAVSWVGASIDRPSPCPEPRGVIQPPVRNAGSLLLPPPGTPRVGSYSPCQGWVPRSCGFSTFPAMPSGNQALSRLPSVACDEVR